MKAERLEFYKKLFSTKLTQRQLLKTRDLKDSDLIGYLQSLNGVARYTHVIKFPQGNPTRGVGAKLESLNNKSVSHTPWSSKQFVGVELELCLPLNAYEEFRDRYKALGLSLKSDGSLRTTFELENDEPSDEMRRLNENDTTLEVTLLFPKGDYRKLEALCRWLNEHGGYVNHTCGVHVHLDQRGKDRRSALLIYSRLQNAVAPFLSKIVDMSRLNEGSRTREGRQNYCRLNRDLRERYSAVNAQSLKKHQTIEVRLHHGSINFEEIKLWIETLQAISEAKFLSRPRSRLTFDTILARLELPQEVKQALLNKANFYVSKDIPILEGVA